VRLATLTQYICTSPPVRPNWRIQLVCRTTRNKVWSKKWLKPLNIIMHNIIWTNQKKSNLATCTCNVWRNMLFCICQSTWLQFKRYVDTIIKTHLGCDDKLHQFGGVPQHLDRLLVCGPNQTPPIDHQQLIPTLQTTIPTSRNYKLIKRGLH